MLPPPVRLRACALVLPTPPPLLRHSRFFLSFRRKPESRAKRARNAHIRVTACGVGAVAEYNGRRTRVAWRA